MSPHRIEVPVTFPSAFLRSDGIAAGLSEWVLRSPRFNRPFHGVRTAVVQQPPGAAGTSTANTTDLHLAAARDYYKRLGDTEIYSHETALLFLGCPIRVAHRPHVSVLALRNASRTRGVVGHQHGAPISCVLVDQHLPVAPPQQALLQAVPSMSLAEVVVAIDYLLRPRGPRDRTRPILTMAELDALACTPNQRCGHRLRLAASLARIGAESRMETLLRLILAAYGLDDGFELQVDLSDDRGWIGRFDLVHAAYRLIVEYDGEQHRTDARQYAKDERRISRAWKAGYQVLRFRYPEVAQNPEVAALAVAEALGVQLRTLEPGITGLLTWR